MAQRCPARRDDREVCTGHDYSPPGKLTIDWDDPAAKDALVWRWSTTRTQSWPRSRTRSWTSRPPRRWRCWPWPGRTSSPPRAPTGPRRWRIAQKVAEDRVTRPWIRCRRTRKSGEAAGTGIGDLAADPQTGIITDEKLTRASGEENSDPRSRRSSWPRRRAWRSRAAGAPQPRVSTARTAPPRRPRVTRSRWPGTATPPTAPGTCAARSPAPGPGGDQPKPLQAPVEAASPSMTSPSMSRPARSPARPAHRRAQPHPRGHIRRLAPEPPLRSRYTTCRPAASSCCTPRRAAARRPPRLGRAAQLHGLAATWSAPSPRSRPPRRG